jgi:hypothetical protein
MDLWNYSIIIAHFIIYIWIINSMILYVKFLTWACRDYVVYELNIIY